MSRGFGIGKLFGIDINEALNKLTQRDVRQLPVVDHDHLAGLLRRRDIFRWLQLESEEAGKNGGRYS